MQIMYRSFKYCITEMPSQVVHSLKIKDAKSNISFCIGHKLKYTLIQGNIHDEQQRQLCAYLSLSLQIGIMNSHHIYDYIFQSRAAVSPAKRVDTSTYQIPPPPRPVLARKPVQAETQPNAKPDTADPFGTLRASTVSRKKENHETTNFSSDDEVFLRDKPKQIPNSQTDKFGTLKAANRVVNRPQPSPTSAMDDYRSATLPRSLQNGGGATQYSGDDNLTRDEVRLADELLKILDEFQKKSYSAKEMEEIFENWRRKSDLAPPATQEKVTLSNSVLLLGICLFLNVGSIQLVQICIQ